MASLAPEASISSSKAAESTVHTYHCLCTQLILATTTNLDNLSTRSSDKSYICPLPEPSSGTHNAYLLNTTLDNKPTVVRLEDGFEKRYLEKCGRCELTLGYHLDKSQYEELKGQTGCKEDIVYLLPGGILSTGDMRAGKKMDQEIEKLSVKA